MFFGRIDSHIRIASLDDARPFTVVGYKGDAVAQYLSVGGFSQDLARHDHINPGKLKAGRFDLWATGECLGPYSAAKIGVKIKPHYTFRETVMSIARNRAKDQTLVDRLNDVLGGVNSDGTAKEIVRR